MSYSFSVLNVISNLGSCWCCGAGRLVARHLLRFSNNEERFDVVVDQKRISVGQTVGRMSRLDFIGVVQVVQGGFGNVDTTEKKQKKHCIYQEVLVYVVF